MSAKRASDGQTALPVLEREFPTVAIDIEGLVDEATAPPPTLDLERWRDRREPFDGFDAQIEQLARAGAATLVVRGELDDAASATLEMLTRWQRLLARRNAFSCGSEFDALLDALARLHDDPRPLVRADYNHALDTWQWVLRQEPRASVEVQMAALLHDIERLESEADARVEHRSPDYQKFKDAHARRGAEIAGTLVRRCGASPGSAARVAVLVGGHERAREAEGAGPPAAPDPERVLLNDADALSFFSQNSAGYIDYFGPEQTRRKIAYTLGRMRPGARARLTTIRLRADVGARLDDVMAERRTSDAESDARAEAPSTGRTDSKNSRASA